MDTIFNGLSGWGKVGLPGAYDEQDGKRGSVPSCAIESVRQAVGEQGAVREVGKGVVMREVANPFLGLLLFADIGEHADVVADDATGIANRGDALPGGKDLAGTAQELGLALPAVVRIDALPQQFVA